MLFNGLRACGDHSAKCFLQTYLRLADGAFHRTKSTTLVPVPPPPKRPETAYLLYLKEFRKEFLKSNSNISQKEFFKEGGAKWKALDESSKESYVEKSKDLALEYKKTLLIYMASLSDDQKKSIASEKKDKGIKRMQRRNKMKLKELNCPKMPPGAFLLYLKSQWGERGSIPVMEFSKSLGEKWKVLAPSEKEVFQKEASLNLTKYKDAKEKWKKQMVLDGNEALLKSSQKRSRKKSDDESTK